MTQGPPFQHLTQEGTLDAERQGPPFQHDGKAIPADLQGPPLQHQTRIGPLDSARQGPPLQHDVQFIPTDLQGPPLQHDAQSLPTDLQGPPFQHLVEGGAADSLPRQGPPLQHISEEIGVPPVIEDEAAVQRDALQTFLVDVTGRAFHSLGDDVEVTAAWSLGLPTGPFTPATPQPFDPRHVASLSSPPLASPGDPFNFVWHAFFDLPEGTFTDVFVEITATSNPSTSVVVGPITVSTTVASQPATNTQALARRNAIANTPLDFLGCGLLIPFRRGSRDFVHECGIPLIRAAVAQILGTRASVGSFVGELPWRPDFGNKVWITRHRKNDRTLAGQVDAYVREALRWESRVVVTDVVIEQEPAAGPNELRARVKYQIISEDVEDNRVFLPEFEELVPLAG